jgi:hypothetical protein
MVKAIVIRHRSIVKSAVVLSCMALCGCQDKEVTANSKAKDCLEIGVRYQEIVSAMCIPWSARKATILAVLAERAQDDKEAHPDTDPSQNILDIASSITAKDCVLAGYPDPGEKGSGRQAGMIVPPGLFKNASELKRANAWYRSCELWGDDKHIDLEAKSSERSQ